MYEVEVATQHAGAAGSHCEYERAVKQPTMRADEIEAAGRSFCIVHLSISPHNSLTQTSRSIGGARPSAARQCGLRTGAAALRYAAGRPPLAIVRPGKTHSLLQFSPNVSSAVLLSG
eukprot:scaffold57754_cov17-Prasinocladus_malaysianus.AAC.2